MKKIIVGFTVLLAIGGVASMLMYRQSQNLVDKTPNASNQPWIAVTSTEKDKEIEPTPTQTKTPTNADDTIKEEVVAPASVVQEKRSGDNLITKDGTKYPVQKYTTLAVNDPNATQWWTDKIGLPVAHDIGYGSNQTILAIIDTGINLTHEEFANRFYKNSGEVGATTVEQPSKLNCSDRSITLNKSCNIIDDDSNGVLDDESGPTTQENKSLLNCTDRAVPLDRSCNLIDDDGNGLIDDVTGFDFIAFERSVQPGEVNPNGAGTAHGTMVAGVAAASQNNSKGIAGVDGFTKILPIQALNDDGVGDTLSVSRAIRYAADQGADVISLSLGSSAPDSYLRQAVQYAISKGSVVVAAAGNDGCQCISYPAAYEEVVAVGASTQSDVPASFSSYGSMLDVLAPGVGIYSTSWSKTNGISAYAGGLAGTSFATPIVSGLLTLARSHQPNTSGQQLAATITEQANILSLAANSSRSNSLGYGRVNAAETLQRASQTRESTVRYMLYPVSGGTALGAIEPSLPFQLYTCENRLGTTPLYHLSNISKDIYTISAYEKQKAIEQGYSVSSLGYYCLGLPTDKPAYIRSISIPRETENRVLK